jgi:hypothetical protein
MVWYLVALTHPLSLVALTLYIWLWVMMSDVV